MSKPLTAIEKETMGKLAKKNESLRWFFISKPFQCKLFLLDGGWYEKVGTKNYKNNWLHTVKHKRTKDIFLISDVDCLKIIRTFEKENLHLL